MKGQYFSFDAIIASVIFVLALVALLSYWHSMKSFLDYQNNQLSKDAVRISNLLFIPPTPLDAECATMERLGFARDWDDKRVDSDIITCAQNQDQQWLRERLGSAYNVSIRIEDISEDVSPITLGGPVPDEAANVVNMRRLATVVNNTDGSTYIARIDLRLYN